MIFPIFEWKTEEWSESCIDIEDSISELIDDIREQIESRNINEELESKINNLLLLVRKYIRYNCSEIGY